MGSKEIVIYSTPTWPYCRRAKEYLSRKGASYIDYDVSKDRDRAREMVDKTGQMAVPVIIVNDEIVVGFNQAKLDELLSN